MIRFGLAAVANVGVELATAIQAGAPYADLLDFLTRVPAGGRAITSLIEAGALDRFGASRAALLAALPLCLPVVAAGRKYGVRLPGWHVNLTGPADEPSRLLDAEFQALGCYVSGHPLDLYDTTGYGDVEGIVEPQRGVSLAGLVTELTHRTSRAGRRWAVMRLSGMTSAVEVLWFPDDYDQVLGCTPGEVVGVSGSVTERDGRLQVVGRQRQLLPSRPTEPPVVKVRADSFDLDSIRSELAGLDPPVHLVIENGRRTIRLLVSSMLHSSHDQEAAPLQDLHSTQNDDRSPTGRSRPGH